MNSSAIVDCQIHIWGPDTPERPWPAGRKGTEQRPVPLMQDEILSVMDAHGVARAALVPTRWDGDKNDLALEAARRHPDRFGVVGRIQIEQPVSKTLIKSWRKQPGMLGIRLIFNDPDTRPWLNDGTADWVWPACEKASVPIMVIAPDLMPLLAKIAEAHPGLRLIIDHMGLVSRIADKHGPEGRAKDADALARQPELLALARYPNVGVKVSCLPAYTNEAYPFPNMQAAVRRVYDAFGPERMFWGSDFSRLKVPYRQNMMLFTEAMPWLSADDKALIMGGAITHWLDWPLAATEPRNNLELT